MKFFNTVLNACVLIPLSLMATSATSHAQRDRSKVEIQSTELRNGLYMLKGAGGNIVLSTGADHAVIIDSQYADMTQKIDSEIARLSKQDVRYVLNTHWHFDHTGGNSHYGKKGNIIIAHENTRTLMSSDQIIEAFDLKVPAADEEALPLITFNDSANLHLNGLTMTLIHVPRAHTSTDAFVIFKEANVIHSGDVFISGSYLFIDTSSGGSFNGLINATEKLIAMSDEHTLIVPGHGELSNRSEVTKTLTMLTTLRTRTNKAIDDGLTLKQFLNSDPTGDFDDEFGNGRPEPGQAFAAVLYSELNKDR